MPLTHRDQQGLTSFRLEAAVSWPSFEKFRVEGAKALEEVRDGKVATLQTKTGQYRILEERDFQKMLGLARDVDRLRGRLRVVLAAVKAVQKHRDDSTIGTLLEAAALLGDLPALPTRQGFDPMQPEEIEIDAEDEVILDPSQLNRPV